MSLFRRRRVETLLRRTVAFSAVENPPSGMPTAFLSRRLLATVPGPRPARSGSRGAASGPVDSKVEQDMVVGSRYSSSSAHLSAQAPVEPPPPPHHVLPEPVDIGPSLMKPASTCPEAVEALTGRT